MIDRGWFTTFITDFRYGSGIVGDSEALGSLATGFTHLEHLRFELTVGVYVRYLKLEASSQSILITLAIFHPKMLQLMTLIFGALNNVRGKQRDVICSSIVSRGSQLYKHRARYFRIL